ncbi:MAG: hypothetical protein WCP29_05645 [Acidobacteriota bacterium]
MRPHVVTPFEQRKNRTAVWLGLAAVAGGVWVTSVALNSIRTGTPISMLDEPTLNGWLAFGSGVFAVVIGLGVIGLGVGWVKPRR